MLEEKFVRVLLCLTVALSFSATATMGADILFLTSSDPTHMPGDDALKAFLESLGHTVTYLDDGEDEATTEAAAAAADLVFMSESVGSSQVNTEITEIEIPMVITESYAWDEMGLTRGGGEAQNVVTTDIEIVDPGHPLAAGFSGTVTVLTDLTGDRGPARFGNGIAGDEADVIATATLADGQTYDFVFVYEKGAALAQAPADGSDRFAADVRVCLGFDEQSYLVWNENAYALLEAAVKYVLGSKPQARKPDPHDGALHEDTWVNLSWLPGDFAVSHDVYIGDNFDDVNEATRDSELFRGNLSDTFFVAGFPGYPYPDGLVNGMTYYWRIDEVNDADPNSPWKGQVWSFTIADYIIVDDFEDYDAGDNQIWFAWHDGLGYGEPGTQGYNPGNGTGSAIGDGTTDSYTEEVIIHGGSQSMPYIYNNDKDGFLKYSEATKTLTEARDWTEQGVKALSLWFRGYPPFLGGFTEAPAGTFTLSGEGADIEGNSDQFHFAWQQFSGAGSITARVRSIQDTDPWAKVGLMIRDTLDADSAHAMVAVTPGNGVWFGRRTAAGNSTDSDSKVGLTTPLLLKIERSPGGLMRASYSTSGFGWTQLGSSIPINMNTPMYIGLAVTSHNPGIACEAVFSSVTSDGTGSWTNQDIGLSSNEAVPMYVTIANNNGTSATVKHEDPNATLISAWTEWNIDLKDFSDQGVDLTDVNSITIGFGDMTNPQAGGSGTMYFDDVRLYPPRCILDKVTLPEADLNNDCVVDFRDLVIMANDWLDGDYTISPETPEPVSASWEFENNVNGTSGDNGIAYGGPTYGPGKSGQAINFDGINDYVVVTDSPAIEFATGSFSIALWVKSSYVAGSDKQFIICNGTNGSEFDTGGIGPDGRSSGKRYVIKFEESNFRFTLDDDVTKTVVNGSSANFATGDWVHAVVIRDNEAKELRIYCNGELESTNANPATADISSPGEPLYIGAKQQENAHAADSASAPIDHYFEGMLDDLRLYNYALSHSEVLSIAGLGDLYIPLTSPANISDEEPVNSKKVNFKDFAVLADEWLKELFWPE